MKTRLSNKKMWLNTILLSEDDNLYIGIDAHKKSFHIALWLNGTPAIDYVAPPILCKLIETFKKLRPAVRQIVYEADPTGYSLARGLHNANFPVRVVAPSKTPRQAAIDSKTDSLD